MLEKIRAFFRRFFQFRRAPDLSLSVEENLNFEDNAFKNRIWYRGNSNELAQLYGQMSNQDFNFWGAIPTSGLELRKIHTGIPRLIVTTLANVVCDDLDDFVFKDGAEQEFWNNFAKFNKFDRLVKLATKQALYIGDGAFRVSFDNEVSPDYPLLEFYAGDKIDITRKRGRITEITFFTKYFEKGQKYTLAETRGYGYITYKLYRDETEVPVTSFEKTADLADMTHDPSYITAVPLILFESERWPGRGESIFDAKTDNFDSLDEIWSQWMDALRTGRAKTYIPSCLIPRNGLNGGFVTPNAFDNKFIQTDDDISENGTNQVTVVQPDIPTAQFTETYCTALDLCLQGLISPSTLGIDVKKLDNAEAQREKEKATLYTRQSIVAGLTDTLKEIVSVVFKSYADMTGQASKEVQVDVNFGEYASPSFESVVEILSNPNTPMSVESKVEEMWGDKKNEQWKREEVDRIKNETGIVQKEEPAIGEEAPKQATMYQITAVLGKMKNGSLSRANAKRMLIRLGLGDQESEDLLIGNSDTGGSAP